MAYWQWTRALEGSLLSWGYSFQWPLFGLAAVALWAREVRLELRRKRGESVESDDPPLVSPFDRTEAAPIRSEDVPPAAGRTDASPNPNEHGREADEDAYNHYLAWLSANPDRRPSEYPGTVP